MSSLSINNVILSLRRFYTHGQLFTFRDNPMAALRSMTRTAIHANTGRAHTNGCACLYARWVDALKAPAKRRDALACGGVPPKRREVATRHPVKHGLVTDMPSVRSEPTGDLAGLEARRMAPAGFASTTAQFPHRGRQVARPDPRRTGEAVLQPASSPVQGCPTTR